MVAPLVARDWSDLFITDEEQERPSTESSRERRGLLRRLRESMARTRQALGSEIQAALFTTLDEDTWERLEEALIMADVGAPTTAAVVRQLEQEASSAGLEGGEALSERLIELLAETARVGDGRIDVTNRPTVIMAVGVNGTGKTTTIGKLSQVFRAQGKNVLLCAADTFRAAAIEQLEIWGQRTGTEVIKTKAGGDPAAVLFDALQAAVARKTDYVVVDTAGRLHTKASLMAELEKMRRTAQRIIPGAPHETLLVMDATTGQNGLQQARLFTQSAGVTGIVLTKLDGTAKGGVVVAICRELGLPVRYVGVGEKAGDLLPFDPKEFVDSLFE
jgi:fused signal recognition particle receptor